MAKKNEPKAGPEARAAYPHLAAWWDDAKKHGRIYSRCDVSRSGMGAKVLLWTIRDPDPAHGETRPILEVCWPWQDGDVCAKRLGFSLKKRAFFRGGCGYDRAHDVALSIGYLLDGPTHETLTSLPYIDTLNQPE